MSVCVFICVLKRIYIYIYTYIDIDIFYMHICCIYTYIYIHTYKVILLAPGYISGRKHLGLVAWAPWKDCWRSSPPFGNCRTGGTILSAMYTVVWGFTMGLGTMNMCFSAFANAKAAIHRINAILDEPIHIVGAWTCHCISTANCMSTASVFEIAVSMTEDVRQVSLPFLSVRFGSPPIDTN